MHSIGNSDCGDCSGGTSIRNRIRRIFTGECAAIVVIHLAGITAIILSVILIDYLLTAPLCRTTNGALTIVATSATNMESRRGNNNSNQGGGAASANKKSAGSGAAPASTTTSTTGPAAINRTFAAVAAIVPTPSQNNSSGTSTQTARNPAMPPRPPTPPATTAAAAKPIPTSQPSIDSGGGGGGGLAADEATNVESTGSGTGTAGAEEEEATGEDDEPGGGASRGMKRPHSSPPRQLFSSSNSNRGQIDILATAGDMLAEAHANATVRKLRIQRRAELRAHEQQLREERERTGYDVPYKASVFSTPFYPLGPRAHYTNIAPYRGYWLAAGRSMQDRRNSWLDIRWYNNDTPTTRFVKVSQGREQRQLKNIIGQLYRFSTKRPIKASEWGVQGARVHFSVDSQGNLEILQCELEKARAGGGAAGDRTVTFSDQEYHALSQLSSITPWLDEIAADWSHGNRTVEYGHPGLFAHIFYGEENKYRWEAEERRVAELTAAADRQQELELELGMPELSKVPEPQQHLERELEDIMDTAGPKPVAPVAAENNVPEDLHSDHKASETIKTTAVGDENDDDDDDDEDDDDNVDDDDDDDDDDEDDDGDDNNDKDYDDEDGGGGGGAVQIEENTASTIIVTPPSSPPPVARVPLYERRKAMRARLDRVHKNVQQAQQHLQQQQQQQQQEEELEQRDNRRRQKIDQQMQYQAQRLLQERQQQQQRASVVAPPGDDFDTSVPPGSAAARSMADLGRGYKWLDENGRLRD